MAAIEESLLESTDSRRACGASAGYKFSFLFISLGIFVALYCWDGQQLIVQQGSAVAMAIGATFTRRAVPLREQFFQQPVRGVSQVQRIQQRGVVASKVLRPIKLRKHSVIRRQMEGLGSTGGFGPEGEGNPEGISMGGPPDEEQYFEDVEVTGDTLKDCALYHEKGLEFAAEEEINLPYDFGGDKIVEDSRDEADPQPNVGLDTSMNCYGPNSVINVYDFESGTLKRIEGYDDIKVYVTEWYNEYLYGDLVVANNIIREETELSPGNVYQTWKAGMAGYACVEFFSVDDEGKILEQNTFVTRQRDETMYFDDPVVWIGEEVWPTGSGPVHDAFKHHWDAFGELDIDEYMKDYTEFSEVTFFIMNGYRNRPKTVKGLGQIKEFFENEFLRMFPVKFDDFSAPIQLVQEATEERPGSAFTVWSTPENGFNKATESFIFSADGKIMRHTISFMASEEIFEKDREAYNARMKRGRKPPNKEK